MLKFYGYKKCGTSRKAEKTLVEMGVEYEFIDIPVNPPSDAQLRRVIKSGGLEVKKAFTLQAATSTEFR